MTRRAYQLTLMDDYSRGYMVCDLSLNPDTRTSIRALMPRRENEITLVETLEGMEAQIAGQCMAIMKDY